MILNCGWVVSVLKRLDREPAPRLPVKLNASLRASPAARVRKMKPGMATMQLVIEVKLKIGLWDAIKARIAGRPFQDIAITIAEKLKNDRQN